MITIKCAKCGKVWEYTGKNKVYATCPDCKRLVEIKPGKNKPSLKNNAGHPLVSKRGEELERGDEKFWEAIAGDERLR